MKQWAEIKNGSVRHTFEADDNFTPEFGPPITVVEITNRSPKPEVYWTYDSVADTFAFGAAPEPEPKPNITAARALINVSGKLSAIQSSDALKLLLSKVYKV